MLLLLLIKNTFFNLLYLFNFYLFFKNFKVNNLKYFLLFIFFYFFINLYLSPTFALCETFQNMDINLFDKENNTYKGSKILYQNETAFVTQDELEYAQGICRFVAKFCAIGLCFTIPMYLYLLYIGK